MDLAGAGQGAGPGGPRAEPDDLAGADDRTEPHRQGLELWPDGVGAQLAVAVHPPADHLAGEAGAAVRGAAADLEGPQVENRGRAGHAPASGVPRSAQQSALVVS